MRDVCCLMVKVWRKAEEHFWAGVVGGFSCKLYLKGKNFFLNVKNNFIY